MSYYHHLIKSGAGYGALTTAWISATSETDPTIISALNTLETDLTTYGLTAKIKDLYPMVGGTAAKHKFNFMDARDLDAAFRLTFNGGWTHASTGALPNGTNAYANSYLTPITSLYLNDNQISFYSRTQNFSNGVDIGTGDATVNMLDIEINYGGRYYDNNQSSYPSPLSSTFTTGLFTNSRIVSGSFKGYRNGTSEGTISIATTARSSYPIFIGARNSVGSPAFYANRECAFASIGDGLTDGEAANFYTAVQAFQTTLSRQIVSYGPLTTAYATATGITDVTQLNAFNTFETGLTTYGLTAKLIALYFYRSTSSTVCSYNFMNTALYQQSFSSGWTFTANYAQGDGSSAYSDTGILPSSVLSLNDISVGYNSYTGGTVGGFPLGSTAGSRIEFYLDGGIYSSLNSGNEPLYATPSYFGRFLTSRQSSSGFSIYKDGILGSAFVDASTSLSTTNIFIGARSILGNLPANYSGNRFQDVVVGTGLSATEVGNLNTLLTTLQAAL